MSYQGTDIDKEIEKAQQNVRTLQEAIQIGFGPRALNQHWLREATEVLRKLKMQKARIQDVSGESQNDLENPGRSLESK